MLRGRFMPDSRTQPVITVVGSLNVDTLLTVPDFPRPGMTVGATCLSTVYGGKGANQALAALKQGAAVNMIGCVGLDSDGSAYLEHLMIQNMNVSGVQPLEGVATGRAYITVNAEGQNTIIVAAGANGELTPDQITAHDALLEGSDVVLCQLEVPLKATLHALQRGNALGKTTMLNPSPLNPEFPWGAVAIDFLIVNEEEAATLLGRLVEDTEEAEAVRTQMVTLGVDTLIITRGARDTLAFSAQDALKITPPTVKVVDTVGAGDAFAGAFAVHWAVTRNLLESLRRASIAASLSTLLPGAQGSLPTWEKVETFEA